MKLPPVHIRLWRDQAQQCDVVDFTTEELGRTHVYRWALLGDETVMQLRHGARQGLREMVEFYRQAH